jgi:hypothetical protein
MVKPTAGYRPLAYSSPEAVQTTGTIAPLADLMTGLMMVFLLIAISYMVKVEAASQRIREVAVLYERMDEG